MSINDAWFPLPGEETYVVRPAAAPSPTTTASSSTPDIGAPSAGTDTARVPDPRARQSRPHLNDRHGHADLHFEQCDKRTKQVVDEIEEAGDDPPHHVDGESIELQKRAANLEEGCLEVFDCIFHTIEEIVGRLEHGVYAIARGASCR